MAEGPTPEQQADYLVRKMEQTIRDNRTVQGMSFATWQTIARTEITNVLRESERRLIVNDRTIVRLTLVATTAAVTVGFWGTLVVVNRTFGVVADVITMVAGAVLFYAAANYGIWRASIAYGKHKRRERLSNIQELDRSIKVMENTMQKKRDQLKEKMEEIRL